MRKILLAILAAMLLTLGMGSAASANGGSDGPTPYTVTSEGVQLPDGATFQAHGHVNVRFYGPDPDAPLESPGIHFDPNNGHPGGQWIGKNFIPWSAFGIPDGSEIRWVQVHGYNQHFGEGGQKPVPVGPRPAPQVETRESLQTTGWEEILLCESGEVRFERWDERVAEAREQSVTWNSASQVWDIVWGDWLVVERERTELNETYTIRMTDEQIAACGLPPTGAPLTAAAIVAGALILAGIGVSVVRRRKA